MSSFHEITVGARDSCLSKAQVMEVWEEWKRSCPRLVFKPIYVKTKGDFDRTTSLRTLEKSDFFTKEVDEMVLGGMCRIAIHSAKDLADPLPKGLKVLALTKVLDPRDALVLRQGQTLAILKPWARIATSSYRREECVRTLRSEFTFVDIRGTIEERLQKLDAHEVDGVVIAEAALLRLKLTRERILLPGEGAPLQGRLAIVAREEDPEIEELVRQVNY